MALYKKNYGIIKLITIDPEGGVNVRAKFSGTTSVHISVTAININLKAGREVRICLWEPRMSSPNFMAV